MYRNLTASFSGSLKSDFQLFRYDILSASLKFLWHRFSTSFKLPEYEFTVCFSDLDALDSNFYLNGQAFGMEYWRSDYWMHRF
ncbi:unnamed protein product [Rhizophagus irregularis]|nr:unnamed protein product [Rhizophagus irregularis]